jgi:hypothetical protein
MAARTLDRGMLSDIVHALYRPLDVEGRSLREIRRQRKRMNGLNRAS